MKNKSVKICLVLVLAALLIPYPTESIPEWKVKVVDGDGNPVENIEVFEDWTTGGNDFDFSDSKVSDSEGLVVFPSRHLRLPLALRIIRQTFNTITYFVMPHGSETGGRARIRAKKGSSLDWLYYYESGKIKNILVIRN